MESHYFQNKIETAKKKKWYKALDNMATAQLSSLSINHSLFFLPQLNPTLDKYWVIIQTRINYVTSLIPYVSAATIYLHTLFVFVMVD